MLTQNDRPRPLSAGGCIDSLSQGAYADRPRPLSAGSWIEFLSRKTTAENYNSNQNLVDICYLCSIAERAPSKTPSFMGGDAASARFLLPPAAPLAQIAAPEGVLAASAVEGDR